MNPVRYRNPVIPGFHPDPSVCRVGSDFYLVNSSFEFFPGIPIYHSRNLVNWELVGHAWTRKSQFDMTGAGASRGLFAPTIRFHAGEFFITVTNVSGVGNCILRSGKIEGPWSDPVPVAQGGIDPSLFFDDDGTAYFCSNASVDGKEGIALAVVNPLTGEIRSPIRHICAGTGGRYPEAPHLYKFRGLYYLAVAEGGTEYGHMETLFRSASLWGPYTPSPHNPILTHRNDATGAIQCTGHADFFDDAEGNSWAVCLGTRPIGPLLHNTGRETYLAPVRWDDELWFTIGDGGRIALEMEGPLPEEPRAKSPRWEPLFGNDRIDPEWNFVRSPNLERFLFDAKKRVITIEGNAENLSETVSSPSFIGRRQEETTCEFSARVALTENRKGEAGIAAYYSDSYHYEIFVRRENGGTRAILRRKIHDLEAETASHLIDADGTGGVELRIRANKERYHFEYRSENGNWNTLGTGMTAGLCTEGTYHMTFTGVYLGLFAISATADFSYIAYENGVESPDA